MPDRGRDLFPVLLYHEVATTPREAMDAFSTSPDALARDIELLRSHGFRLVTFSELVDELRSSRPERVASITFDDGLRSFLGDALGVLTELDAPATMYVPTAWIDRSAGWMGSGEAIMSVDELRHIEAAGVEIGSHAHSHPQLDVIGRARVDDELTTSRRILESALGHPVRSFAYPHGFHHRAVRDAVIRAGYDNAAAVKNAWAHRRSDTFAVARMTIGPNETTDWLAQRLDAGVPRDPVRERFRTKAFRTWRRLRARGPAGTGEPAVSA